MACENVIQFVQSETGRFSQEIYNRIFPTSPWIGLIYKDNFPEGMGETISNLTYERSAPTEANPTWSNVSIRNRLKRLGMGQASQHQPDHRSVDKRFACRAEPLVVLAQAPTLPEPAEGPFAFLTLAASASIIRREIGVQDLTNSVKPICHKWGRRSLLNAYQNT
jgi:hypothetical protein